jgi:hypothetical protein
MLTMKSIEHTLGLVAAFMLLASVPSPARAERPAAPVEASKPNQADDPPDPIEENLIAQAIAAYKTNRVPAATGLFEQAYALKARPITASNWIMCLETTHDLLTIEKVARDALSRPRPVSQTQAADYDALKALLDDLSRRIPRLSVTLSGVPVGKKAELKIDGVAVPADQASRWNPGPHTLSARAEGLDPLERSVTLGEREIVRLELTFSRPAPVVVAPAPPPQSSLRTIGLITGAAGLVGIGVGSALGAMAIQKNNESNEGHCVGKVCDLTGQGLRADSIAAGNGSTAAFVIGGAALAAGITLVLIAPRSASATAAQVKVGPRGLLLSGTW